MNTAQRNPFVDSVQVRITSIMSIMAVISAKQGGDKANELCLTLTRGSVRAVARCLFFSLLLLLKEELVKPTYFLHEKHLRHVGWVSRSLLHHRWLLLSNLVRHHIDISQTGSTKPQDEQTSQHRLQVNRPSLQNKNQSPNRAYRIATQVWTLPSLSVPPIDSSTSSPCPIYRRGLRSKISSRRIETNLSVCTTMKSSLLDELLSPLTSFALLLAAEDD